MSWADLISQNITLIAAGISVAFAAICGGIGMYYREKWKSDRDRADKVADNAIELANEKAKKEAKLLDTLTEEFPKLALASGDTVRVLEKLSDNGSDVTRDLSAFHAKLDDFASALVEHGCPDSKEILKARLAPHLERVEKRKSDPKPKFHKPDAPEGWPPPAPVQ